jgi:hypothetical protein
MIEWAAKGAGSLLRGLTDHIPAEQARDTIWRGLRLVAARHRSAARSGGRNLAFSGCSNNCSFVV